MLRDFWTEFSDTSLVGNKVNQTNIIVSPTFINVVSFANKVSRKIYHCKPERLCLRATTIKAFMSFQTVFEKFQPTSTISMLFSLSELLITEKPIARIYKGK